MDQHWSLRTLSIVGEKFLLSEVERGEMDLQIRYNVLPEDPNHALIATTASSPRRWEALGYALDHQIPLLVVDKTALTPFTRTVFYTQEFLHSHRRFLTLNTWCVWEK